MSPQHCLRAAALPEPFQLLIAALKTLLDASDMPDPRDCQYNGTIRQPD